MPLGLECVGCKIRPTKPGAGQMGNVRIYEVYTYQEEEVTSTTTLMEGVDAETALLNDETAAVLTAVAETEDYEVDLRYFDREMNKRASALESVRVREAELSAAAITGAQVAELTAEKAAEIAVTPSPKAVAITADEMVAVTEAEFAAEPEIIAVSPEAELAIDEGEKEPTLITMTERENKLIERDHELGEMDSIDIFAMYEQQTLSAGTIISIDILKNKNINISRIGILAVGIGALGLALYLDDILKTLQLAYTIFTAGLTIPILFGFYKEKTHVSSTGALCGLIFGGGISLVWFFLENPYNIDAVIIGMIFSIMPLLLFREAKK